MKKETYNHEKIIKYYEFYAIKFGNLYEMDKFIEKHKFPMNRNFD